MVESLMAKTDIYVCPCHFLVVVSEIYIAQVVHGQYLFWREVVGMVENTSVK